MVKIRLKRMGAKKKPFYRIIIADSHSPRDGRFIESVGSYNPLINPARVEINEEKVISWLNKGARPSDTVKKLLTSSGIIAKFTGQKNAPKKVLENA